MSRGKWVSVREYARLNRIKSPQVIYNRIATRKLRKNVDWREVEKKVYVKQMYYEEQ